MEIYDNLCRYCGDGFWNEVSKRSEEPDLMAAFFCLRELRLTHPPRFSCTQCEEILGISKSIWESCRKAMRNVDALQCDLWGPSRVLSCRVCGSTPQDFEPRSIFEQKHDRILNVLRQCSNLNMQRHDGYSTLVCSVCFRNLETLHEFRMVVRSATQHMRYIKRLIENNNIAAAREFYFPQGNNYR